MSRFSESLLSVSLYGALPDCILPLFALSDGEVFDSSGVSGSFILLLNSFIGDSDLEKDLPTTRCTFSVGEGATSSSSSLKMHH